MAHLLVIDDEESICYAFRRHFEGRGLRVSVAPTARRGLEVCRAEPPDVTVVDVCLPDGDGLTLLDELRAAAPATPVLVITAFGTLDTATRAVAGKAFDYLIKPLDLDRVTAAVERALQSGPAGRTPVAVAAASAGTAALVGASAAMQRVYTQIAWAAQSGAPVLITGATGTGKDLAARAIHERGIRRSGPFVAVNCGALPETLVESELFGHVKGAFSGAVAEKPGRLELAYGGTLLLDEVGELPLPAQVKLLRFLDNQGVDRLGAVQTRRVDVRILAATNRDLGAAVRRGTFRADLYYRLAVTEIHMPPLAERREDVLPTVRHLLTLLAPGGSGALSAEAEALLGAWDWPGNVRELRNVLQHAVAVSAGGPILPTHFPAALEAGLVPAPPPPDAGPGAPALEALAAAARWGIPGVYSRALESLERYLIRRALAETGGNQVAASDLLGLHRNTLRRRLRALGREPDARG
jgi:two-component system nitrogen regulation response regulator GlnG